MIVHIVFNESEVDLMKQVIEMDESLSGDVTLIRDDFAVGPLTGLDTPEGWNARVEWWRSLLAASPYGQDLAGSFDDRETIQAIITKLDEDPDLQVWLWMGQNQHDVCGYYWLMPQLKNYQGRIMVIYLNNLPFINEKGQLFYPSWLHEIQPKEFLKAKKLARPITLSEFEVDPDEWKRLCDENALVRALEGGKKITGRSEDFYDNEILKNLSTDWQKANRLLSNTLHRMKIKTGDVFIMWRIKTLIAEGKIEIMGDAAKGWKEFDVKLPGVQTENLQEEQLKTN
ncbi:MAG TPA: DUF1835 domain-containing protein [Chitinophagaceae bacterium]|jgi:hypothetical protein|nr:DUF1835 domain-containing protein [Chitinophagaceae bacterium]